MVITKADSSVAVMSDSSLWNKSNTVTATTEPLMTDGKLAEAV